MQIDIVITTYNRKEQLQRALDSAFKAADIWNGRVILVDDASTDATVNYIETSYAKEITSAKLILIKLERNQGVSGAKNVGYMQSNADWVIFLDSDDMFIESHLRDIKVELNKYTDAPIVFFRVVDQQGNFVGQHFDEAQILDLKRYLKHTSYGEAQAAIQRKIVQHEPFDADLRGCEGLGCMRIIRDYGSAILSTIVAREYDRSGDERLSSPRNFLARAHLIGKSHYRTWREFKLYLPVNEACILLLKSILYFFISLIFIKKR